jgi:hypothetical protein
LNDSETENIGKLHCGHTFHKKCITNWFLQNKKTCPNCRAIIDINALIT